MKVRITHLTIFENSDMIKNNKSLIRDVIVYISSVSERSASMAESAVTAIA